MRLFWMLFVLLSLAACASAPEGAVNHFEADCPPAYNGCYAD